MLSSFFKILFMSFVMLADPKSPKDEVQPVEGRDFISQLELLPFSAASRAFRFEGRVLNTEDEDGRCRDKVENKEPVP